MARQDLTPFFGDTEKPEEVEYVLEGKEWILKP